MSLVCLAGGNRLCAAEELHPGVLCVQFFGVSTSWLVFLGGLFSMKAVLESSELVLQYLCSLTHSLLCQTTRGVGGLGG